MKRSQFLVAPDSFSVPIRRFAWGTVLCPLFGLTFCVFWTLMFHFYESTETHCNVRNYLPTISTSIGNYSPQKFIWRISIAVHTTPRLLIAFFYFNLYSGFLKRPQVLSKLLFVLNVTEVVSLLVLTSVSSIENFNVHAISFTFFLLTSQAYMIMTLCLWNKEWQRLKSRVTAQSFKIKKYLSGINFTAEFFLCYFYWRHNRYCEPGVYTFFVLSEYVVVLCNMGFFLTAAMDFHKQSLVIKQWEPYRKTCDKV